MPYEESRNAAGGTAWSWARGWHVNVNVNMRLRAEGAEGSEALRKATFARLSVWTESNSNEAVA